MIAIGLLRRRAMWTACGGRGACCCGTQTTPALAAGQMASCSRTSSPSMASMGASGWTQPWTKMGDARFFPSFAEAMAFSY